MQHFQKKEKLKFTHQVKLVPLLTLHWKMATSNQDTQWLQLTVALKSTTVVASNLSSCLAVQFDLPCESLFLPRGQNDLLKLPRLPRLQIFWAVSALALTAFCMTRGGKTGASCTSLTFETDNIMLPLKSEFSFSTLLCNVISLA